MNYFIKLKNKDILTLIGFFILGFTWILTDQIFLKQSGQRFIAFILLMILMFYLQYRINKPHNVWLYANTIAAILLILVVLSSLIMHVFIYHDFETKFRHSILIWTITVSLPYITGFLYLFLGGK